MASTSTLFRYLSITTGLLLALCFAATSPAQTQKKETKKEGPAISVPHAILIDAENGSVLFEQDADKLLYPASLAKLMTAEYIFHELEQGHIKLTDEYVVSEYAWRNGGAPSRGSTMFAAIHSKVPVDNLLHGVIVQSANDACIVFAEALAGNEAEFAGMLTKRAREIGLTQSVFTNSTGLHDPDEKMTTRELAMLARHIIRHYPQYYSIFAQPDFTWNKIRQPNRNPLLKMSIGADGLKTGYTKEAGYGLVGSAVQNGLRLIAVVNGIDSSKERGDEAKKLLEWGFHNFEQRILFNRGQPIGDARVFGGALRYVPLLSGERVQVMLPKSGPNKLTARIVYSGPVRAPVTKGQSIGTLKVWRNDNVILTLPLQAAEDVGQGTLPQRAFDAATELAIALFRAGAERL
jgi:serine-type D-Ala-D-Ala carboxypeptidase (penicillin-binding protein 5/6)